MIPLNNSTAFQYQLFPNFVGKGTSKSCFAKFLYDRSATTPTKVAHLKRSESLVMETNTLETLTNVYEAMVLSILNTFPQPEYYPKLYCFDALSITIEYCDTTLQMLAQSGFVNFSRHQVKKMVQELYWGVYQLHIHELVHLDLKLDNILVKESGQVVISDAGTIRFIQDPSAYSTYGGIICSPPELVNLLVPPEWALDLSKNLRQRNLLADDAWRTAVIAWVCLMGNYPDWCSAFKRSKSANEIQKLMNVPLFRCARTDEEELLEYALDPILSTRPSVRDVLNFMADNNWT